MSLFEAFVLAVVTDGHCERHARAGRGRQDFSLCQLPAVRYHAMSAARLRGTCSSLGKILFSMDVLCVWFH